jgi:hypothetical protein
VSCTFYCISYTHEPPIHRKVSPDSVLESATASLLTLCFQALALLLLLRTFALALQRSPATHTDLEADYVLLRFWY